jgi:hypothetical protein
MLFKDAAGKRVFKTEDGKAAFVFLLLPFNYLWTLRVPLFLA